MTKPQKKAPELRFKGFAEDWEQRKLGEVTDIFDGTHQTPKYTESGVKFVSVENISNLETRKYISQEDYDKEYSKKQAEKGDVLMTRIGDIGTSKVIETDQPLAYYVTLALLKPKSLDSDFLGCVLESPGIQRDIWRRTLHIAFPKKINLGEINQVMLTFPDTSEQKLIGQLFKQLDNTITLHQRKYDALLKLKEAYLQNMFPEKGEFIPKVRFANYVGDWEQRKLGEVVDVRSGKDYKHLSEGDIPVYGTGGYMLSVSEALSYEENAIGIGRKGTIDKPYLLKAPFWTVDTLFYAVPKDNNDLDFTHSIFQKVNWKQKDESTGVPSLSKTTINKVQVSIPNYEEQRKIGSFFQEFDHHLITLHQHKLEKLKHLKEAYLQKMFV